MRIERNRYLLFWTAHGLQIVLPNPTTPALTREAGLVNCLITLVSRRRSNPVLTNFPIADGRPGVAYAFREPGSRRLRYTENPMPVTLSLAEARRLAIASQGFRERPSRPTAAHLRKLASRVHAFQIDSV